MDILYDTPVYRPPSEAHSFILQVTLGCSFNRCSFCSMYRSKKFIQRPLAAVQQDIAITAYRHSMVRRVFLADGDALVVPTSDLLSILLALHTAFPQLERVSSYALPVNLHQKSLDELVELREAGLQLLYYGIETGSANILKRITKGAAPSLMRDGLLKAKAAGMAISATVILGLGGKSHWEEHIDQTAALVNSVPLDYLSTLQLMLDPMIREEFYHKFRVPFQEQDDMGLLREQERLISQLHPLLPLIFRSNHASNALALAGVLPQDRDRLLAQLARALAGETALRPEWLRGY